MIKGPMISSRALAVASNMVVYVGLWVTAGDTWAAGIGSAMSYFLTLWFIAESST